MSEDILYEFEERVRPKAIIFLTGFSAFWFGFFGYDLIVNKAPFTVASAIGTAVWIGLVCLFAFLIAKGGAWRVEVTEEAIRWHGPLEGDRTIRHADVESFEVIESRQLSPRMCVRLKSGETVFIPDIGDWRALHRIFLIKWKYLGRRRIR